MGVKKETLIDIFLSENSMWLEQKSEELKEAFTTNERNEILERIATKCISFGIKRGILIHSRKMGLVKTASRNVFKNYVECLEREINDSIMDRAEKKKNRKTKQPRGTAS